MLLSCLQSHAPLSGRPVRVLLPDGGRFEAGSTLYIDNLLQIPPGHASVQNRRLICRALRRLRLPYDTTELLFWVMLVGGHLQYWLVDVVTLFKVRLKVLAKQIVNLAQQPRSSSRKRLIVNMGLQPRAAQESC